METRESQDVPRRIADLDGHDAYQVLGVRPDAAPEEIKVAWRRELARTHPDLGGSDDRAQLVNCAYEVLTRHRDDYDDLREIAPDDGPVGLDVLSVEPNGEPLDGAWAGPAWSPGRGLLVVVAVLVVVAAVLVGRGDPTSGGQPGWTATEVEPGTGAGAAAPSAPAVSVPVAPTAAAAGGSAAAGDPGVPVDPGAMPWSVPATTVVMAASAPPSGGGHRCEVRGDGSLWCAGGNARGQLGDGTRQDAAVPVRVVGGPGARWATIAVGGLATCGLQEGGSLWCWGDNSHGQIGDGTNSARDFPVAVEPGSRWLAVAVDTHACAVRADRSLWCWGAGSEGGLGDGHQVDEASPVRVGAEAGWVSVSTGPGRTCAVRSDGSEQCWGSAPAGTPSG